MASSSEGHVDVVQALLQHGANVNAATNDVRESERERERQRGRQRGSEIKSARASESNEHTFWS